MIGTFTQGHDLPMMAPAAILRCVGRIDFDELSASLFRFTRQLTKELRPCGIMNALRQAMIMGHPVDMQVFYADDTVGIDNLSALLVGEVLTAERNPFMDTCNRFTVLASLRGALCQFGMLALDVSKGFLFLAEKRGVLDVRIIGQGGKGFQPNVNPDLMRIAWQAFGFTLNREGDIPLSSRGTADGTCPDFALDRTMVDHLDTANFGEAHPIVMGDAETRLRESETIAASISLISGIARLLTALASAEESLECQVNTHGYVLKDLRVDNVEGRAFSFQYRKGVDLPIARQAFATLFIGGLPIFKQVIIQPSAFFKNGIKLFHLWFARKNPIREHFMHINILGQTEQDSKGKGTTRPRPQIRNVPDISVAETRGFTARFDKAEGELYP
jgi:hypothetical protein